ncbi:MAG: BTAD domain-containing putative transcriptional regulator [Granulosicoccus sp.]
MTTELLTNKLLTNDTQNAGVELHIKLLGKFQLTLGTNAVKITARKDMALVAYLANSPAEPLRRSHLAALLWPQSDDPRARESLKQALLRIKKSLPSGTLISDRHTACLVLKRKQVDIVRAEDFISDKHYESIVNAARLISDSFLVGLDDISNDFDDWRNARYQDLLETFKLAALNTIEQAVSQRRMGQAEELSRWVVKLDPIDEDATRYLISAYLSEGRDSQARRAFDELKKRLHLELGVQPESATLALIQSIRPDNLPSTTEKEALTPRVAVMPFDVGADESSQRYFAEGLTDDITTDLACNTALEVLPASTFAGIRGDVSRVLNARGATHGLYGSVRKLEGRLRVNTRLISTRDNQIVWAQRYDRKLEDLFDMQDAISAQIVRHLNKELLTSSSRHSDHGTRNAHAYEMFHKGRSLYLRGINNHSLRAAKALLDRSIEMDPGFARAYAQLAICESYLAMSIVNKTGEDLSPQVLEHGRAALRMKPDLALGHAAIGLAYYASGQYQDAEGALQKAIELDENLFEAQFFLARNRRMQGDHAGAVERFRIASTLRPDDFRSSGLLGDSLKAIARQTDAEDMFTATIIKIEAELDRHPDNAGALAFGAPILADLNRVEQAREWSAWALAIEPEDRLLRYNQARLFAILGELDVALEHLEIAFAAPSLVQRRLALWMRYDHDLEPLRKNRQFKILLKYSTFT